MVHQVAKWFTVQSSNRTFLSFKGDMSCHNLYTEVMQFMTEHRWEHCGRNCRIKQICTMYKCIWLSGEKAAGSRCAAVLHSPSARLLPAAHCNQAIVRWAPSHTIFRQHCLRISKNWLASLHSRPDPIYPMSSECDHSHHIHHIS